MLNSSMACRADPLPVCPSVSCLRCWGAGWVQRCCVASGRRLSCSSCRAHPMRRVTYERPVTSTPRMETSRWAAATPTARVRCARSTFGTLVLQGAVVLVKPTHLGRSISLSPSCALPHNQMSSSSICKVAWQGHWQLTCDSSEPNFSDSDT